MLEGNSFDPLLLDATVKPRVSGHGYSGLCPSHNDKNPSLSITQSDKGTILLHCHSGCSFEEVCNSLNINSKDLFISTEAYLPSREKTEYIYHDEKGNILYRKFACFRKRHSFSNVMKTQLGKMD
jgi:hypothetical protein